MDLATTNSSSFIPGMWNLVEDMREKGELKDFLIATPDGGASFYINSKDGKERYEDFLLQEFLPFIEKRYRASAGPRQPRDIGRFRWADMARCTWRSGIRNCFSAVSAHSAALIEKLPAFLGSSVAQSAHPIAREYLAAYLAARRSSVLGSGESDHARADSESGGVEDLFRLRGSG